MTEESPPAVVTDEEDLARYILFNSWIRNSDQTVRPDAFIPHPYPDLSVTRHINLSEEALWKIGQEVADERAVNLYGCANIQALRVRRQSLEIESAGTPKNPNHANIINWPTGKPAQKMIAQQLAANSSYRVKP